MKYLVIDAGGTHFDLDGVEAVESNTDEHGRRTVTLYSDQEKTQWLAEYSSPTSCGPAPSTPASE